MLVTSSVIIREASGCSEWGQIQRFMVKPNVDRNLGTLCPKWVILIKSSQRSQDEVEIVKEPEEIEDD